MSARDALSEMMEAAYEGGGFEAFDSLKRQMLDAYRAEVLREGLTPKERTFLRFALDVAAEEMFHRDGFTEDDWGTLRAFQSVAEECE